MNTIIRKELNSDLFFYFSWGYYYFSAGLWSYNKKAILSDEFIKP
ncbi:hypothetical protein [Clostridium oryzae]|uniref:Uncharacterized protein n=1 Tax=Clostridium oryzae TaxID=1450648 RepID=A0A1V4ITA6_9CLOT|nr:hypothetical protein [Clostridium oryzae]OPJ63050.1 hypothetical protein CLORY_14160 [Clostridium oryzae]